jgi:hypothetical protein
VGSTANRASKPAPASVIRRPATERGGGNGEQQAADEEGRTCRDHGVEARHSHPAGECHRREGGSRGHGRRRARGGGERLRRGGGQPDEQAEPEERQRDDRQRASPGASAQRLDDDDDNRGGPDRHQRREPDEVSETAVK